MAQLLDVKFDGGQGDLNIALTAGVLVIKEYDSDPNIPSSSQVNVPVTNIFDAISKKANNPFVTWGLGFVGWVLKRIV